jgi:hypothetical protein
MLALRLSCSAGFQAVLGGGEGAGGHEYSDQCPEEITGTFTRNPTRSWKLGEKPRAQYHLRQYWEMSWEYYLDWRLVRWEVLGSHWVLCWGAGFKS